LSIIDFSFFQSIEFVYTLIIIGCLIGSAYFSATETALTSLTELKIKHLLDQGNPKYNVLEILLRYPRRILTTILIGNNTVNILAASTATVLVERYFHDYILSVATGVTTIWILIFGEIIPKNYARAHALGFAIPALKVLKLVYYVIYPITIVFVWLTNTTMKFAGESKSDGTKQITENELEFLINVSKEEGVIKRDTSKMLSSIFDFDDTIVREVMIPRTSITSFPTDVEIDEVLKAIEEKGHSRIPIYEESIDNIVGVLYAKDLLNFLHKGQTDKLQINKIIRKAFFVPESKKIDALFQEMKREKLHIAIVVDEYGGTAGLITMEDLLEEIVGEIRDEYDQEEDDIVKLAPKKFRIQASLNIDQFREFFHWDKISFSNSNNGDDERSEDEDLEEENEEFDSVGGYFLAQFGSLPKVRDRITNDYFTLEVAEVDGNRITKLILYKAGYQFDKENKQREKKNKKISHASLDYGSDSDDNMLAIQRISG